jgi:hypothetical protein
MRAVCVTTVVSLIASSVGVAGAQAPSSRLPRNVDPETVRMIDRGLDYLKNSQRPDGSWSGGAHGQSYPAVMTALAGLALLANGSTPLEGKYSENVRRAMNFLLECGEKTVFTKDGVKMCVISSETGAEMRSMYGHGFGMLFLAECYGCELDVKTSRRLRTVLEHSAALISSSQSAMGGWYYTPHSGADEGSVTVTQMQCLRAARNAGIKINKGTIERAAGYLEKSQVRESDGTISIAYQASQAFRGGGGGRPPLVGAAVCVLYSGGRYDSEIAKGCLEYVKRRWSNDQLYQGHYFYAHLYISQALYQAGGKDWDEYYVKMRDKFKSNGPPYGQAADGSWNGDYVGPIYGTAIATLILQLPYNYLPIFAR